MRLWHVAAILLSMALAGYAGWETRQQRRQAAAERILEEIRDRGIPAHVVHYSLQGTLLLEAGTGWDRQPVEWQEDILDRLQAAYGADHVWRTNVVPYRDADDREISAAKAAE